MEWIKLIVKVLGFSLVIIVLFNLLKIFVLPKLKVNKWVILAAAVLTFLFPPILASMLKSQAIMSSQWVILGQSGLFVILFLWFMDVSGFGVGKKASKKDGPVIRPKAKPNRIKKK